MRLVLLCLCLIPTTVCAQTTDEERDDAIFGEDAESSEVQEELLQEQNDTLQLGGMLYVRSNWRITDSDDLEDHRISLPNLVDLYLDSRPNDHVRGFIRGRLNWNPSVGESESEGLMGASAKRTNVLLDEIWLKFDVARAFWITTGQQHIRWGTTRIWNPVDVINTTQRIPLALFDERVGVPAIKIHIPVESLGWNFYVLGLTDQVNSLDDAGVAGRAEFVFGTVELGLTSAYRDSIDPKVGFDLSAGIWDFDITSELGLTFEDSTPTMRVSAGIEYAIKYNEEDILYLGGEYFYNEKGRNSTTAADLAESFLTGQPFQPFYWGKHYGALFVSLPAPGSWQDTSFTATTIGNLSDKSFVSRLDVSQKVLTYMSVQLYVAASYGEPGELTFGGDIFTDQERQFIRYLNNLSTGALDALDALVNTPNPVVDLGLRLRIDL